MTRKPTRNYSLSVVAPFIAILTLLIAAAVLAQTSGAGQPTGKTNAVLTQAGTSAPAQAERPLTPWTDGAGRFPVKRSQTKRHGASPMDSPPLFLPVVTYSIGEAEGESVAVGDLNGDGNPDLVVAGGPIEVLLGNGDGTFQPAVAYQTGGEGANSVAVADVNGDGKLDLLVTNPCGYYGCDISAEEGTVGVLLGNGDGTFQPAVTYATGGVVTQAVVVADVNGDGKPDLLVINPCGLNYCFDSATEGTVGVLLGNGDGTFQPVQIYPSGASWAAGIAVADVNGDGKPDLIVANTCAYCGGDGEVAVLLGNGDGTFRAAVSYDSGGSSGSRPSSVAVADLNGDGKPDILVTNFWSNTVGVLLGNDDGIFQPVVTYGSGGGGMPTSIAVTDVNGDGKLDLLVANYSGGSSSDGTVGVLLGNGDGTFQAAQVYNSGGWGPSSIAVADVNGDGRPDVLATDLFSWADHPPGLVGVLLNNGTGNIPTATTLVSSPNPSGFGQAVNLQASVTSSSGTPTGIITFFDGSVALGREKLESGSATISISSLAGGSHPITAAYRGYQDFSASTSAVVTQIVNPAATTTSLPSSTLNPSTFGQMVTFTAAVSSFSGTPTGNVTFFDGAAALASATLLNGSASISVSSLAAGSHSITAAYQGSVDFSPSTSTPLNQLVSTATTTTAVASSLNPAFVRQTVTYTAAVTSQYGGAASGTVTFQDGGVTIATVALASNQAAYSTSYATKGTHAITAVYSGDASNAGSTSPTLTEYIWQPTAASKTVVTTSGSPSFVGQPVTFTATVTSTHGAIPDGELVTFYDGGKVLGSVALAGGTAAFTTSSLSAVTHTIKATYAGDATFEPSTGSVKQVVDKYPTTTALSSSLNPSNYGQRVTLTATVTSAGPTPTGWVTFKNGSVILGSKTLNAGGVASLTTAKIPVGADTLTATYNGDALNAKSVSAAITQTVSQASISMVLTSYPNPSTFGASVKFTAKLTSNGGLPSGQPVTFSYNGATLGTANVNSKGVATFSTTSLPRGADLVTAAYAGSVDYSAASATVTQVVN